MTPRQRDLMLFLQRYMDRHDGIAPNYAEMSSGIGLASKAGVARLLTALEEQGRIRRLRHRARAIELVKRVPDAESDGASSDAFRRFVREIAHDDSAKPLHQLKARELLERFP